jgi:hypothetical protein
MCLKAMKVNYILNEKTYVGFCKIYISHKINCLREIFSLSIAFNRTIE